MIGLFESLATHLPGVSGLLGGVCGHLGTTALKLYHERKQSQLSADGIQGQVLESSYRGIASPSLIVHGALTLVLLGLTVWAYQTGADGDLRKALTEWTGLSVAWFSGRLLTK